MVKLRRGLSTPGCLVATLLVVAVGYFGVSIGEHYFRFYEYQDSMRQEVRFAGNNTDAQIRRNLRERVDSLGLPEAAAEVTVQRDGRHIAMEAVYYVLIEVPLFVREKRFSPHAEGNF